LEAVCISDPEGILSGEIMAINGLKRPSGRDFTVGGVKGYDQSADKDRLSIEDLFEHGMNFLNLIDRHPEQDEPNVIRLWVEDLMSE
jgi:hypothetical protein